MNRSRREKKKKNRRWKGEITRIMKERRADSKDESKLWKEGMEKR